MELAENTTILDREFTLPDKTTIRLGAERFKAAECLFNPNEAGLDDKGFHEKIFKVIEACEIHCRLELM